MITEQGPKVLEFNVRFGDPEAQAIVRRFKSDLVPYLLATARGELDDDRAAGVGPALLRRRRRPPARATRHATARATRSTAWRRPRASTEVVVFHAGTPPARRTARASTSGGRVLCVTALGDDIERARARRLRRLRPDRLGRQVLSARHRRAPRGAPRAHPRDDRRPRGRRGAEPRAAARRAPTLGVVVPTLDEARGAAGAARAPAAARAPTTAPTRWSSATAAARDGTLELARAAAARVVEAPRGSRRAARRRGAGADTRRAVLPARRLPARAGRAGRAARGASPSPRSRWRLPPAGRGAGALLPPGRARAERARGAARAGLRRLRPVRAARALRARSGASATCRCSRTSSSPAACARAAPRAPRERARASLVSSAPLAQREGALRCTLRNWILTRGLPAGRARPRAWRASTAPRQARRGADGRSSGPVKHDDDPQALRGLPAPAGAQAHGAAPAHLRARLRDARALQRRDAVRVAARGGRPGASRATVYRTLSPARGGRLRRVARHRAAASWSTSTCSATRTTTTWSAWSAGASRSSTSRASRRSRRRSRPARASSWSTHSLRLMGYCPACVRARRAGEHAGAEQAGVGRLSARPAPDRRPPDAVVLGHRGRGAELRPARRAGRAGERRPLSRSGGRSSSARTILFITSSAISPLETPNFAADAQPAAVLGRRPRPRP